MKDGATQNHLHVCHKLTERQFLSDISYIIIECLFSLGFLLLFVREFQLNFYSNSNDANQL